MYWVYLGLFIAIVFVPMAVKEPLSLLAEDDFESLIIFCLGTLGVLIYLAKEKALIRLIREKLLLQKQTNIITRDLSDSYSYIGELNRKFDIVKNLAFHLPKALVEPTEKKTADFYSSLLEAVCLLAKVDAVALYFVDLAEKKVVEVIEEGNNKHLKKWEAGKLLEESRMFWEHENWLVARSPREAAGIASFLVFPKKVNAFEDAEIFKILASEALFLYCGQHQLARNPTGSGSAG
jgi:hypothetical protein